MELATIVQIVQNLTHQLHHYPKRTANDIFYKQKGGVFPG